jgi:ATP-dependent RNA helicase DeaD
MDVGRRGNADARWLLPLLCRRGHITKNEVGAIRIGDQETAFEVRAQVAERFAEALRRTAGGEDDVRIEPLGERPAPPQVRRRGPPPARAQQRFQAKPYRAR